MVKRKKIEQEENEVEEKIIEMLLEKAKAGETTYADLNKILNGLRGKMIQKLLNLEFEEHMKYKKGSHEEKKTSNRRNGISSKKEVRTNDGSYEIEMPRDREGSFEPILVPKRKRIIGELSEQITLLYAKGNSIRDIKEILEGLYGTKLNEEFISEATKMVSEEVMEWKKRPLKEIYSIIYMDCLYTTVRKENKSEKVAIYVALGIDITGKKEVIGFWEGESESSSFWYGVLEEIKERGVKDILFLCTDGVSGFKEIMEQVYPKTNHQRCIVHIIRNMTPCVRKKEMQELCNNLKQIYKARTKEEAESNVESFREKYKGNKILMKKFENNVDSMLNLYNYSENIRKLIYTTNPIESLNSCLRKVTNGKGCFVSEEALEKVLYLRIKELSKKWLRSTKSNWSLILNELIEIFGERVEKYIDI
jgi:putative transposase